MLIFFNIIIVLIAFILQTSFINIVSFKEVKPDLIVLIVIYAGLFGGKMRGGILGAAAGFIKDSMSYGVLGINTLLYGVTGFILGCTKNKILSENTITHSIFIFMATFLNNSLAIMILNGIFLQASISSFDIILLSLYQAAYNIIIGHIIFIALFKIEKKYFMSTA